MVEEDDETNHFESFKYDFDAKGNFLKGRDGYQLSESVDYHDLGGNEFHDGKPFPRIIGKTNPKTEILTEGHPGSAKKMSVMQKVEKQLNYLTYVMDLDEPSRKHWFYRLKREYELEAKIIKRMEKRQAKKDFRKQMKKHQIMKVLEEEENFDTFYDSTISGKAKAANEKDDGMPKGYENQKELIFYNNDIDFMRHHKRTR